MSNCCTKLPTLFMTKSRNSTADGLLSVCLSVGLLGFCQVIRLEKRNYSCCARLSPYFSKPPLQTDKITAIQSVWDSQFGNDEQAHTKYIN